MSRILFTPLEWIIPLIRRKYFPMLAVGSLVFATGLTFRVWQDRARGGAEAVEHDLRAVLQAETEPRRDEHSTGILGLTLASGAIDADFSCDENPDDEFCRKVSRRLASIVADRGTGSEVEIDLCAGEDAFEAAFGSHARCEFLGREQRALLYVPATTTTVSGAQVARARRIGELLAEVELNADDPSPSRPVMTSIFYVSSEGHFVERSVFAETPDDHPANHRVFWTKLPTRGPDPASEMQTLRGYRVRMDGGGLYQLRDRSYVDYFRTEIRAFHPIASYHSRPYVDLAGGGVVRTTCHFDAHGHSRGFFGVLCADYALPLRTDANAFRYAGILDVAVAANRAGRVEHVAGNRSDTIWRGIARLSEARGSLASHVRTYDGDIALVKLRRQHGVTWWLLMAHAKPRFEVWLALFIVSAVFGSLATIAIVILRTLRSQEEEELAMLRNLQVGVLRVLGDRVVGANDRAEELLRRSLPALDMPERGPSFDDVYEATIYERFEDESGEHFVLVTQAEIDRRRENGESFPYVAQVRRAKDDPGLPIWVEVWGSPFFSAGRPEREVQRTFAVIRPAKAPKLHEAGRAEHPKAAEASKSDGSHSNLSEDAPSPDPKRT